MLKAMFPGTFDPPTNGHLNLITRAAAIFEKVYVVIAVNRGKSCFFSEQERFLMMQELLAPYGNVEVVLWDRLVVEFAAAHDVKVMLRGVRALADFGYEFELAMTNKGLAPDLEIMFMPTDPKYFVLRSSAIKEIADFGGDVSSMVPPLVVKALKERHQR
ncbi:pantetheine-phosphate adenylyltransferase [Sediminispirochaeta smaragdinae]|jgi:pantetheine-phosphate adenylyltransferase|uniref:Phosphopantetheine adenylyltransferase n=1 Tax=Sediminispirochaeta smaragdinae (strain DSM 11293 / JCM 15392 / SEBR 4228) TaxID=573413 RepID=E1R6J4_SEDSS|nr:pantetheine-phosphate adenylyltransferase [Sediminispirochaeta smaragdinae]ADK81012.1 pantetheine-phosphate adenylyltransferase [Sediminispirochaeta smaragdinae DSM 11293]